MVTDTREPEDRTMNNDSRRNHWRWAFYDWANSAFATTVMAGFFPLFFKQYWSGDSAVTTSTFWLGLGNATASFLIMVLAPLLGALADAGGNYRRLLLSFAGFGMLATAALCLVDAGQWPWAILLYILAFIGFSGANVFYDGMLPGLTTPEQRNRVSALGYSLGYLGGGLLFAINVTMTLKPTWFGLADAAAAVKVSFVMVSLWWAVFALPLATARLPASLTTARRRAHIGGSFRQVLSTLRDARRHRNLWLFLIAYWFYIDGVATIIRMAVDYGMAIGLPANSLITALLLVQFIGFPCTIVFGRLADHIGTRRGLWIGLWVYVIATVAAAFMSTSLHFHALACCLGLVQGGVQSLSRALFSQLIPVEQQGEYFGFLNMLGKAAAVLGPLLVGVVAATTHSSRIGILSVIVLFLIGMWFLGKVEEPDLTARSGRERSGVKHPTTSPAKTPADT